MMKIINWIISFLLFLAPFLLLECSTRWWIGHYGDPLQRARKILKPDEELGWVTRSNLKTEFEEQKLFTDQKGLRIPQENPSQESKRILVLGPSSAFGWGVEYGEAWPALISENNVLNASQIAYSIVQGEKLYNKLNEQDLLTIKTVIIAYGVNDIDRFRFFDQENMSDVEYFNQLKANRLDTIIYSSGILSLLARGYQESKIYLHCGYQKPPIQRVGVDEFTKHLRALIFELRKRNIEVLLVNSPNAIQVEASDTNADESDRLYRESADAAAQKQCALSRRLFFEAKKYESWRVIRDINRINLAMERIGSELNVPVADIASRLDGEDKKSLFVDPIHFSVKGHQLAADVIKKKLKELN